METSNEKPPPKKRGRKPGVKNKITKDEKNNVKKKRGRKPKNIVNTVENINNELHKNYIIKLNPKNIDNYDIKGIDENLNFHEVCSENHTSEVCWNCCHGFHNSHIGVPLKYSDEIFYIYGDFCSLECAARYVCDNFKDSTFWEILSLINLYNMKINNNINPIKLAPERLTLKMFGGIFSIDEYRSNNNNNQYNISIPPVIPLSHNLEKIEINTKNNMVLNNNLKLYRKKKCIQEKKSITNSMGLDIN